MELFKIPICDCNYITKCGKVFSNKSGRMVELKQTVQWKYYAVSVWVGGKSTRRHVHRLLALTFIPNPLGKPEVNHKDGDKLNNLLDNLEWVTKKENAQHAQATGLSYEPKGEDNGRALLTEKEVLEIYNRLASGASNSELADEYGVSRDVVAKIKSRKSWRYLLKDLPPIPVKQKGKSAKEEDILEVCKMLEGGINPTPIAEALGISVDVVYDVKRRRSFNRISKDFKW